MTDSLFRPEYERFRQLLIHYRRNLRITQSDLAAILGKPQSYVSKYESGERRLDLIEFFDVAQALQLDARAFVEELQQKSDNKTILETWGITIGEFTELLNLNPSLRGRLLGYIAEFKLRQIMTTLPGITYITKFDDHNRKKKGDLYIIYRGRAFDVESKSLQTHSVKHDAENNLWRGNAQVDASDRRIISLPDGTQLNTTLLRRGEFDILAVSCYAFEHQWRFIFAKNSKLPSSTFRKYSAEQQKWLIASLIPVTWPPTSPFSSDLLFLLDELIEEGGGREPEDL